MQQDCLVSVVLPTHNRAQYLGKAVKSVLSQTYKNIELIIVNDASTDGTSGILPGFSKEDERVIIVTNHVNLGYERSLNKGVEGARGKYIARIDDDDSWSDPQKLEKQVEFLENNKDHVLVGGGAIWIDKGGKEIFKYILPQEDEEIRKKILLNNCFVHSSVVFRKEDWKKAGKYDEKLTYCDWALWLELGKFGKLYNFPECFVHYLKWENNMTNFNIRENLKEEIIIRRKYQRYYPGYFKAFLFGHTYYLFSFLPFQTSLKPILAKIKKIFF